MLYIHVTFCAILTSLRGIVFQTAYRVTPAQSALLYAAHNYLNRTGCRFQRLFDRWLKGKLPRQNPKGFVWASDRGLPIAATAAPLRCESEADPESAPTRLRFPRRRVWLLAALKSTNANCHAGQLQHLLTNPLMPAFLAAAPQAGRILRPLCHMLGIPAPAYFAKPPAPRKPRPPRAAKPRPQLPILTRERHLRPGSKSTGPLWKFSPS